MAFPRYVFGTLGNEANVIIQYYLVSCAFLVTPKYMTLNNLDGLFGVKFCFRTGLADWDRTTSENNCVKTYKDRHILSAVQIFGRDSSFWRYKVWSRLLLMTYRKSHTRFRLVPKSLVPKSTTLEFWMSLNGHYVLFQNTCVFRNLRLEKLNEDRLYRQRRRCRAQWL